MNRAERWRPLGPVGRPTAASAAVDGGPVEPSVVVVTCALALKLPRIAGGPVGTVVTLVVGGTVVVGAAVVGAAVTGEKVAGGLVAGGEVTGGRAVVGGGGGGWVGGGCVGGGAVVGGGTVVVGQGTC